jgi:hypothetical protein
MVRHRRQNSQIPCFRIKTSLLAAKNSLLRRVGKLCPNAAKMLGEFSLHNGDKSLRIENSLQISLIYESRRQ